MENLEKFPLIKSVVLNKEINSNDPYTDYLFNPTTNKGFSVSGLAAMFCRELNGKQNLNEIIQNFEKMHELTPGKFTKEIENLISDLQKNQLIEFHNLPVV